jgi:TatD DNase family protein
MYFDAHNHLQDPVLQLHHETLFARLHETQITRAVVNGTTEADWPQVTDLAARYPQLIIPSYGLHPWWIAQRSSAWQKNLTHQLEHQPTAHIGEIGIDHWKTPFDAADQDATFLWQYDLARDLHRTPTIHCLRAWDHLWKLLKDRPAPAHGFLLHAYGGPPTHIDRWVALGAYFSFSGYFLYEKKSAQREAFRRVPLERLLVETDAPSMPLPADLATDELAAPHTVTETQRPHHPANLPIIYQALATLRDLPLPHLIQHVQENFLRLFQPPA